MAASSNPRNNQDTLMEIKKMLDEYHKQVATVKE